MWFDSFEWAKLVIVNSSVGSLWEVSPGLLACQFMSCDRTFGLYVRCTRGEGAVGRSIGLGAWPIRPRVSLTLVQVGDRTCASGEVRFAIHVGSHLPSEHVQSGVRTCRVCVWLTCSPRLGVRGIVQILFIGCMCFLGHLCGVDAYLYLHPLHTRVFARTRTCAWIKPFEAANCWRKDQYRL